MVGDTDGQYFELAAGESVRLPVANVNLVQVTGSADNQVVNWIARG